MPESLDLVVTAVATKLMAANASNSAEVCQSVLADLVEVFGVDHSFLRYNDHQIRASKLVAEWPRRVDVPDPDPIGIIYFADADPVFAMAEHRLPPPGDEAEKQDRNQLLLLGITTAGLGGLVYLRHHHPAIHRQVVGAALRYTEDRIMKRPARFKIRALNKDDQFWGRARNLSHQAAHQFLLPRLRAALKIRSSAPPMPAARIASSARRYGEAQHAGFRRREQSIQLRAQAVCDIAAELLKGQIGGIAPEQDVTLEIAQRWVRSGKKPAEVSCEILALWCGESARRIKQTIDKATRQQKEAEEVHRNLDSRGYSRKQGEWRESPESRFTAP